METTRTEVVRYLDPDPEGKIKLTAASSLAEKQNWQRNWASLDNITVFISE